MPRIFPLARMSPLMWVLTLVAWAVPAMLAWIVWSLPDPSNAAAGYVLFILLMVYAWVWFFMRPSRFELGNDGMVVVWPLRSRLVTHASIVSAEIMSWPEMKNRFGRGFRVGVGGLWGQFGLAYTRRGWLTTYISTMGPWVLLVLEDAKPLLISPGRPEQFLRELGRTRR